MGNSPTVNSLNYCRRDEWPAQVVEHGVYVPIPGAGKLFVPALGRKVQPFYFQRRRDLFGGIDILVLDDQHGVLGVQATDHTSVSRRVAKCRAEPRLAKFVARGNRLEVWGWRKVGARWHRIVRQPLGEPST